MGTGRDSWIPDQPRDPHTDPGYVLPGDRCNQWFSGASQSGVEKLWTHSHQKVNVGITSFKLLSCWYMYISSHFGKNGRQMRVSCLYVVYMCSPSGFIPEGCTLRLPSILRPGNSDNINIPPFWDKLQFKYSTLFFWLNIWSYNRGPCTVSIHINVSDLKVLFWHVWRKNIDAQTIASMFLSNYNNVLSRVTAWPQSDLLALVSWLSICERQMKAPNKEAKHLISVPLSCYMFLNVLLLLDSRVILELGPRLWHKN